MSSMHKCTKRIVPIFLGLVLCFVTGCSGKSSEEEPLIIPTTEEVIQIDVEQIQKEVKNEEQKKDRFADSLWKIAKEEYFSYWELDHACEVIFQRVSDGTKEYSYCNENMQDLLLAAQDYFRFDPKYVDMDPSDFSFYRKEQLYMNIYADVAKEKQQEKELQKVFKKYKIKWQTSFNELPFTQENFNDFWTEFESFASEETKAFVEDRVSKEGLTRSFLEQEIQGSMKKLIGFDCYTQEGDKLDFNSDDPQAILDYISEKQKKLEVELEKKILNTPKIEGNVDVSQLKNKTEYYILKEIKISSSENYPTNVTYSDAFGNQTTVCIGGPVLNFGDRINYDDPIFAVTIPKEHFVMVTKGKKEDLLEQWKDHVGYLSYFSEGDDLDFSTWDYKIIVNDRGCDVTLAKDEKTKLTIKKDDYLIYLGSMGYHSIKLYEK